MDKTTRKVHRRRKHPTTRKVERIDLPWYRRLDLGDVWLAIVVLGLLGLIATGGLLRCAAEHGKGAADA